MKFLKKLWNKLTEMLPNSASAEMNLGMIRTLEATVIRACWRCGAKGVDQNNKYVGPICPSCGAKRNEPENLGQIWRG